MMVLTFQVGREPLALDIRRVREVVPRVRLTTRAANRVRGGEHVLCPRRSHRRHRRDGGAGR